MPAPSSTVGVLTSDALQITGLQSITVTTVQTAAGAVQVIELKMTGATITGLSLQGPCIAHTRVDTNAAPDVATGGLTIDATALQATIQGIPITITAAAQPIGALTLPGVSLPPLPTDTAFLTLTLFTQRISAGAMALSGAKITSSAC
jgi:hypothetical protein